MQRLRWTWLFAVAALAALVGCGPADRDRASVETGKAAKMSDSELESRIKSRLNEDPALRAADLSVSANVDQNEVRLSGNVESEALRMKAVELARGAHPGLVVTDKIDVHPRELSRAEYTDDRAADERRKAKDVGDTIGSSADDAWIHSKIVATRSGNTTTPERKINVDVDNNVVTLRGTVDTAEQKAEAGRVAKETGGVKRVNNLLKVGAKKEGVR